jgi:hypothetical protein
MTVAECNVRELSPEQLSTFRLIVYRIQALTGVNT